VVSLLNLDAMRLPKFGRRVMSVGPPRNHSGLASTRASSASCWASPSWCWG